MNTPNKPCPRCGREWKKGSWADSLECVSCGLVYESHTYYAEMAAREAEKRPPKKEVISVQEFANDIVYTINEICQSENVPPPTIVFMIPAPETARMRPLP